MTLYLFLSGNISMDKKSYQGDFLIKNADILGTCRFFSVIIRDFSNACITKYPYISIFGCVLKHEAVNSGGRGRGKTDFCLFLD